MNTIYVTALILSNQLFGAAMPGSSAQDRFNCALKRQLVVATIRAFEDLPHEERSEHSDNYQKFMEFIDVHRAAVRDNMQLIIDIYPHSNHPLRLYVAQKNVDASNNFNLGWQPETTDKQQVVAQQRQGAELAAYHAWLNHKYAIKPSTRDVPAKMAHCTLQQKIIKLCVQEYMHGAYNLKEMIYYTLAAGYGWSSLVELFAQEFFCANLKRRAIELEALGCYFDALGAYRYPNALLPFFAGVSLEQYHEHDMLPEIFDGIFYVSDMSLFSLDGMQHVNNIALVATIMANRNRLTEISDTLCQYTQLRGLAFTNNNLTALPDAMSKLTQLQTLSLNKNFFKEVPRSIIGCTQLHMLDMSENQLSVLPNAIGELTRLEILALSNNQLQVLPDTMQHLTRLSHLFLCNNPISQQERERITDQMSLSTHGRCSISWD